MAFGRKKDDDEIATGRYIVETVTALTTGRKALQEAVNEGDSKGWSIVSVVHNDKNGQFVIVWEKPKN